MLHAGSGCRFPHVSLVLARFLAVLALGAFVSFGISACGDQNQRGSINERAVDIQRLSAFEPKDLLVMRSLKSPVVVPSAEFMTANGPVKTPELFKGHWTLFYIGYTFCPDVCPTELTALAGLLPKLQQSLPGVKWQIVFLSVDPERDTPKRINEYVHYFDKQFMGMTGTRSMIDKVTKPMKAGYRISAHTPGDTSYEIDHDTAYRLISPDGKMVAILPSPHDPAAMDQALVRFFKEVVQ
ncbi:SCO family protein [Halothiobacillus sp.]|uniref:SCO family protein n=1 Tax=Halothiobacillus sp. TaxID=1891311 RepID=UPI002985344E|nr:SCO family protein [Halothiobacillus sp.]